MAKNIKDLFDATAFDSEGEKIGSVKEVFVNDDNGQPTFVEVNHGLFGMGSSLVPLRGHKFTGEELTLAFPKDRIKDAPEFDTDSALTPEQQSEIFRHYGVENATDTTEYANENAGAGVAGAGAGAAQDRERTAADREVADRERTAADRDNRTADNEIIRSEERANVSKDRVATGEARLRKYVVSDKETVEVPVTREEVSVERTPISEADAKNYDGKIGEDEASVTLHEDKVNVEKETVPVEKINLNKDQVQDTERHTTELRKEQVDTEGAHLKDERTDRK
ncbi:PRC and DUF2382 domain-containing protein [Corynebacterium massiliense]|uniref:PRC-barrel domain protein n=1 Tax=Corynebacterium massiliense DSM 45435 TaxID=1121364 RepID=A0ABY7U9S5_9CORY|nr:PRC and DUF2382 domain-containing protein [Corynebacterium massiliense]WCZ32237.1 PRC-barrel domain protein [Corynebacterium massiliense DSM 45435]